MSAFLNSGRSDHAKIEKTKGRKRPQAAISPKAIDEVADDGSMTIAVVGVANEYPLCHS